MTAAETGARSTRVVILGGGPAGLGAALGLARRGFGVTVMEARDRVGGNAGSFELHGIPVDYGSHRLHPATDPEILTELRGLLEDDLRERPRHGRILLKGRWIHFPLRPLDLALRAPPSFALGVARDAAARLAAPGAGGLPGAAEAGKETFASVLLRGLGPTVCNDFYFPYARKIWGLPPQEISPTQARKRVSSGSLGALLRRLLPGGKGGGGRSGRGTFFYPAEGFGQISRALAEAATAAGAEILLETRVRRVHTGGPGLSVEVEDAGGIRRLPARHVWSTLPLGVLARMAEPPPPPTVLESASALPHRSMVLVYLVLGLGRYTEYDAHYFPGPDVPLTRLSEPRNYSGRADPRDRTVLCAEIPCAVTDPVWEMDDGALAHLAREGIRGAGLPEPGPLLDVAVRRLPAAYPLYHLGYEPHLERLDAWVTGLDGVLSFGRLGLHAHDNTHHALAMARAAVACLGDDGGFDRRRWALYREEFKTHVVED